MIIQFEILDKQAVRILEAISATGWKPDPNSTDSVDQQKWNYLISKSMAEWDNMVFVHERNVAIANEPNDSAALQAARYEPVKDFILSDNEKNWKAGEDVKIGMIRLEANKRYVVVQDHKTQVGWEPSKVPALYVEKPLPSAGQLYPNWKQPTGAQDAYKIGDRVYFVDDKTNYESVINANVWSPSVYPAGWKKI